MSKREPPKIGITMGYAAGIGPEIIIKSLVNPTIRNLCKPLIIGDSRVLKKTAAICNLTIKWNLIEKITEAKFQQNQIDLFDIQNTPMNDFKWGKVSSSLGKASGYYLEKAWEIAKNQQVEGLISGTLHKEALHKGGYEFRDELELFSKITNSRNTFFVGINNDLWTMPIADHIPFREITEKITEESVLFHIKEINRFMQQYGYDKPRIAVSALNIHGGENGLFGDEEIKIIKPAISEAQELGINVVGPYPADTIFIRAQRDEFDSIVGMYHDQINIGRKLFGWEKGTSLMMGLPVPCGTTAHGTAFDIAGKCLAKSSSMEFTIEVVSKLARNVER